MSRFFAKLLLIIGSLFTVYLLREEIFSFIFTGRLPLIGISISPIMMIAFWIIIVPTTFLTKSIGNELFWSIIENIGKINQRRLNRQIHQKKRQLPYSPTYKLLIVATLSLLENDNTSTGETSEKLSTTTLSSPAYLTN